LECDSKMFNDNPNVQEKVKLLDNLLRGQRNVWYISRGNEPGIYENLWHLGLVSVPINVWWLIKFCQDQSWWYKTEGS